MVGINRDFERAGTHKSCFWNRLQTFKRELSSKFPKNYGEATPDVG